jgi:hypothetical protein
MSLPISGLVGYPSEPVEIGQTICRALDLLHGQPRFSNLISWEENDIPGRFITEEILDKIGKGSLFIADITRLNFNVVFEIGYAIGCKKRVFLICNELIRHDNQLVLQVGIFDTLGYKPYKDSSGLAELISGIDSLNPINFESTALNNKAPVYVLLPPLKGDIETHLIARIKKARLFFRSFDPQEHIRLSALEAIESVAESHGVIASLLPSHFNFADVHNHRAAFVAGLAQGMGKTFLLMQSGDDPVPVDYRDFVRSFKFPEQIDEFVSDFAIAVYESVQSAQPRSIGQAPNLLQTLTLGASSAENEFQELGNYYLETDEFMQTLRGEVQIVRGRKGSGKTAIFFQLRDRLRKDRKNVILDLKPEGFQLRKFKEQVLDYLELGTQEHTITAFWEYLLLLEICQKILKDDKQRHLNDHTIFSLYRNLETTYKADEFISEGDFAERMLILTQRISADFEKVRETLPDCTRLSSSQITELIYKHDIHKLRSELAAYLRNKKALWILFDNLDKGWPPYGIAPEDVLSLRCLVDAIQKLEHSFQNEGIYIKGVLFIRNDVYENLIDSTSDRGKLSHALIDWTDEELLIEILRRRLNSANKEDLAFYTIWPKVCISHIKGEESSHYLVERCLMRPRSLIDLVRFCRSHAINLGHSRIESEDIMNGEEQYSTQLVNDICYEMQDIFPWAKDVLYEFIECPFELDLRVVYSILSKITVDRTLQEKLLDTLLWYGVLGFKKKTDEIVFIYSVGYDIKHMKAMLSKRSEDVVFFVINPAFWRGLGIKLA